MEAKGGLYIQEIFMVVQLFIEVMEELKKFLGLSVSQCHVALSPSQRRTKTLSGPHVVQFNLHSGIHRACKMEGTLEWVSL